MPLVNHRGQRIQPQVIHSIEILVLAEVDDPATTVLVARVLPHRLYARPEQHVVPARLQAVHGLEQEGNRPEVLGVLHSRQPNQVVRPVLGSWLAPETNKRVIKCV